jgi:hypothetical protein
MCRAALDYAMHALRNTYPLSQHGQDKFGKDRYHSLGLQGYRANSVNHIFKCVQSLRKDGGGGCPRFVRGPHRAI